MRLPQSRRALAIFGIAALCSLTACAGYTPTPVANASDLSTDPAPVDVEPTDAAAAEAAPEPDPAGSADAEPEPEPAGAAADATPEAAPDATADATPDAAPDAGDSPTADATPEAAQDADTGTVQTKWGPLTETDRKLITGVRLAGLWEMPLAQDAVQRAGTAKVRQISREIAQQHHTLDKLTRDVAAKLQVKLPVKPTDEQQQWMNDVSSKTGTAYDKTYVKWLRLAHGKVFALIGTVRGSTQNTLVRRFAEQCNSFVLNHQRLLESTGLTTPESFPTPSA
ncbi:DUF4142 domain-containing protein [Nonomuraea sp. SYSU D8015]|uniref:DUF4142 domain-containing protein n=1 Tax=Nonomuraea sp. SYSU D8015 TaxID=2593644 RepID=UPI001660D486|nr:DUF4142 domain-containing protein [Nonomuraea sp. SYSU D8015]